MPAITVSGILLSLITIATLLALLTGMKKILKSFSPAQQKKIFSITIISVTVWMMITGLLAALQVFAGPSMPPKPMFTALVALVLIVAFSFTSAGRKILKHTPLHWLVIFQAFRVLVELWFWHGYKYDVFPRLMSFEGANHDIYAGVLALIVGIIAWKLPRGTKPVVFLYNIIGIALLANTLRAAALSMPSAIQQYEFDERLLLLGQFPFIFLPAVLVPLALGFHFLSLRQLFLKKETSPVALMA